MFASALFVASIIPSWALAQSTDPWAEPLNLSHSGIAIKPSFVIDSDGIAHVVWQDNVEDDLANYVYTRFDGDQWSVPVTTELSRLFNPSNARGEIQVPIYTGPNPLFIAGPGQDIFAFWISPHGRLFTSTVKSLSFGNFAAWASGNLIAPEAASFAVAVDASGELHLAYFHTVDDPENPSGIYYTRSKNSGRNWDAPILLYESPYLRRLAEGEANLSLTTTGTDDALHVYVAWDNRPRKQVFLAQSTDGGVSWEQPTLIAGPAPSSGLSGPFNIHVGANQNSVVLVWQSGRATNGLLPACSQIYQFSNNEGATWSNPQLMVEDLWGCAQSNKFVTGLANSPEEPLYLLTETKSQVFLTAWDDLQWSQPQLQPILSGFEEPEIYTEVIYSCHQASLFRERLYVVGCDQGQGGDVWVTSRALGSNTSSLKPPIWSQLSPVINDNLEIEAVELVTTDDSIIHAFFNQHQDPSIYYTNWDGESWSRMTPVLKLPDGEAGWPAIAAGSGNELFLITSNNRGALYFSRAISSDAAIASSWSTPTRLGGMGHDGEIGSVDVAWDTSGTLYVAYSVPVNEERGIYLVMSKDQGTTWSEPLRVFDGAAAGFDFVDAPSLLTSTNGLLHVIWKVQSIQGDGVLQPLSLYYIRSEDSGHTFNAAEPVVEEPVAWREIVMDSKGNLHLLWQPQQLTTIWDQVSSDNGLTWQYPQGLPDDGRLATVTRDPAGRLHLVGGGLNALGHWLWDGSRWNSEAPLGWHLSSQQKSPVELLAVAVNKQGKMMVVLAEPTGDGTITEMALLYSTRTLELPPQPTAVQEISTETLLTPTSPPETPTPERSSTPASTVDTEPTNSQDQTDRNETSDPISPLTMALLPVALLLLSVLGIVIRRAAQAKDQ